MTDIVDRLRNHPYGHTAPVIGEAAGEIERLRTELTVARNRLGNAVGAIIDAGGYCTGPEDVTDAIERLGDSLNGALVSHLRAERDALRNRLARYEAIAPAIEAHLVELHMDTTDDQDVVDALLAAWREVRGDQ